MTKHWQLALSCLAMLALSGCSTLPDTHEDVTWQVQNQSHRAVMVEFYSQHRNAAWPGGGRAYVIHPGQQLDQTLSCRSTEKICYGAWIRDNSDIYWGTGMDDEFGCTECCITWREGTRFRVTLHE